MAISKLQGQSLGYVGVDLRIPPFTHGQLYVALSRVTDIANLSLLLLLNGTEHHAPRGIAPVLDRISYSHCAPTLTASRLDEVAENLVSVRVYNSLLLFRIGLFDDPGLP